MIAADNPQTRWLSVQFIYQLSLPYVPPASMARLCCNLLPWRQWGSKTVALRQ